ncbi:MAG TPA: pilus assembly protein N-terminal domain-containing protein [Bryobacteraceae bacterium]|nr:pilus assembly protein N-terminal domain-containing protein [Bryobacteraceae bacterium]
MKILIPILALLAGEATGGGTIPRSTSNEPVELTLTVGTGIVIDCPGRIARVAASNPEVADAVTASATEVLFHTKTAGQATMVIWSKAGDRTSYHLTVEPNLEPLRKLLREAFPSEEIDLRASKDSLALVGQASSQAVADRALALIAASAKGAISNLQVAPPPPESQVLLRVRFAELNRSAVQEFGVNLFSTGALNTIGQVSPGQFPAAGLTAVPPVIPGGFAGTNAPFGLSDILNIFAFRRDINLGAIIRDMQTRGLLQILAEPNLVATSGKEASFLAGGEFPVPIAQGTGGGVTVSVQFKEFGIRLSFTPLLTPNHTIRLHVKPEVSSLDNADGVQISGFRIPALSTRRVETDIELDEGQSFVIGGLIDDRVIENLSQVPGLARIPVLGALFKSRSETKSRNELIVMVTPETARPAGAGAGPAMPRPFLGAGAGKIK